jgi:hypothetical protein
MDTHVNHRSSLASYVLGAVLIAIGAMFLFTDGVETWAAGQYVWPLFIIAPGLLLIGLNATRETSTPSLTIAGSVVTMVGLILLYQNVSGHWESWAYAWTLIAPTSIGIGLYIQGVWAPDERAREQGKRQVAVGLLMFALFASFFEIVLNVSGFVPAPLARYGLPMVLLPQSVRRLPGIR